MKLRFGTKEIIAATLGAILFLFLSYATFWLEGQGEVASDICDFVLFSPITVIVVGAMFGPFAGAVCGAGGCMLTGIIRYDSIDFVKVFEVTLWGFLVGKYSDKFFDEKHNFTRQSFNDFTVVHILSNAICTALFAPMMCLLTGAGTDIYELFMEGCRLFVGTGIFTIVVGTPLVIGVNILMKKLDFAVARRKMHGGGHNKPEASEASQILDSYKWN